MQKVIRKADLFALYFSSSSAHTEQFFERGFK